TAACRVCSSRLSGPPRRRTVESVRRTTGAFRGQRLAPFTRSLVSCSTLPQFAPYRITVRAPPGLDNKPLVRSLARPTFLEAPVRLFSVYTALPWAPRNDRKNGSCAEVRA